jgi:hypothetical protein
MVQADPAIRVQRAAQLAARYPHAREALDFYAHLILFEGDDETLREMVMRHGPQLLRDAARDRTEPFPTFAARVLARSKPCYFHLPQAGFLVPEGHGTRLVMFCGVCLEQWTQARGICSNCDAKDLAFYASEQFPHIQTQVCESCKRYLHIIDLSKDPQAQPDVDEIAALPLDVWAIEHGYEKLHPNLIGI